MAPGHLAEPYSGEHVAVKQITLKESNRSNFLEEVKVMNNKRHGHLVSLLASCIIEDKMQQDNLCLVMPLAEGGDMQDWLFAEQTPSYPPGLDLSDFRTNFVFVSIQRLVEALAYLHASTSGYWTAHYDIKPKNILLYHERGKWLWKISDFGHGKLKLAGGDSGTERCIGLGTFEYQPPEYDGLKKMTLAFDVFSMGCVIIELATLVAVGKWNCKSVSTFYEMRRCNAKTQVFTGRDASFRNNLNVVEQWVVELRQKGASPMLEQILDVAQDMILRDPSGRPLACEVAIDIWSLMHPEKENAVFEEQCKRLLYGQMPDKRFNDHNPTRREPFSWHSRSREKIRRDCLIKIGWAVSSKPKSFSLKQTNLSTMSTLPHIFDGLELYGREKLLKKIDYFFNDTRARTVGLFGLGGIGKSHLAWRYAAQVREMDPRTHVFWIQALNMSTFENSYRQIAYRIGNIDGVGDQMMAGVKEWLEDSKNGPWIMVIDGVEQHRPKAKPGIGNFDLSETSWEHFCPWNAGQILITAKAREIVAHYCDHPNCTIQVGDLHPDSGGSLLRSFANPDPRDYKFAEPLAKMLHLPILIKITGRYINIYQQHGCTIQNIFKLIVKGGISRHTTEELDMHQVGFGSVNPGPQDIFTILFDIFESKKTDFIKYHQIFTIICCFSNENVTEELVRKEVKTLDAMNRTFYTLTDLGYLTRKSSGRSSEHAVAEFEVHELIQIMWLNRISRLENGRYLIWRKRMRVLDNIFDNYHDDRSKLSKSNPEKCSIHNLKLRYKIHFEQFLRALKAEKHLEFQFHPYAARCVVEFARMFRDEARFDDAELLLTRLINQGIKAASKRQGTQERLEAMRALAETYRSWASGRTEFTTLERALAVINSAMEEALVANNQEFAWKLQADSIRLYYQKGKRLFTHDQDAAPTLEKAQAALAKLSWNLPDNPPKISDYTLRIYECQALVCRLEALLKKDVQLWNASLVAWSSYCESLKSSTYDVFDIKERKIEGRRHYADTCLDILGIQPSASVRDSARLIEAWSIYGEIYNKRESEYGSESKFAYDAKLDQASAQLKISLQKGCSAEVKDCITTFEQVEYFYSDRLKLQDKDKHKRKCAYDLREAYMHLKNSSSSGSQHDSEIKRIERKYNLKAHNTLYH